MLQDPLSDVIRALDLKGGVFLEARMSAPWALAAQVGPEDCRPFMDVPAQIIAYHAVTYGRMFVAAGSTAPLEVGAGEIVLLPRNDPHTVMSAPGLTPVAGEDLLSPPGPDGLVRIEHGGGREETRLFCGFLASDGASHPVLETLPLLLTVPLADVASLAWIEASVRVAAQELARGRVGSAAVMSRLSELLLVEALRRHCESEASPAGWLGGMRDPQIGRALALLHGDLARPWTVEDIAGKLQMSRTAFVDRFALFLGAPPIRYLAQARLAAARSLLRETRLTVREIAYRVGYEAPVAFNRAFKRQHGVPPAAWRDRHRAATG
ncbi:AraC family transcriptional regulator [Afifella pfennigii]|uniref:AraC family transcriptional regulator n=1 Tax=Afifella pfennigii TaxID=209897 RepID=UPI000478CAB8|nr:AraC family transcriptional regulator [Afifella pfennigii]